MNLDALRAVYADVDRAMSGWSCDRSTDCCHFDRTGREPQLWPNEWALLSAALRARPAPVPRPEAARDVPGRAAGSRGRGARRLPVLVERRCPLLGDDDRCVAYAARPFGCRTYYCERAVGPSRRPPRVELAALGRRIASLAEADGQGGPRALTAWLAAATKRT
jgi:hypothetical protein